MGKVQFTLNGKEACVGGPGRRTLQVIEFVKHIPDGKYFNAQGIADCLKISRGAVQQAANKSGREELDGHSILVPNQAVTGGGNQLIYGSKKGIEALKKKLQEQDIL